MTFSLTLAPDYVGLILIHFSCRRLTQVLPVRAFLFRVVLRSSSNLPRTLQLAVQDLGDRTYVPSHFLAL